jgi:primosomal protein N' (replication factor Y) (superfamily II helicase)
VIIGARSCIFAPVENPGIIIVDEEHDGSYKQETGLKYNARDMAVVRAKLHHIPVILGSATPSVQSYYNAVNDRFRMVTLQHRINQHPLPEIRVVDLKNYREFHGTEKLISPELRSEIRTCLDRQGQALVFLNRRGFASFPVCEACGHALTCRFCDVTLTFHKGMNVYKCHLCGTNLPVDLKCPECGSPGIKPLGFGTEKIEMLLKKLFPDARLTRMDQDTTSGKGQMVRILKSIKNRTVDIIVGTQMLAKGHDFPSITLVGIICADLSLSLPDFRACERTFQLLAQVAGRAGRGSTPGKVILQTYSPDHFSIEASRNQDVAEFFSQEIRFRKALMYPPFSRIILIRISARDARVVEAYSTDVAAVLSDLIAHTPELGGRIQVMGPAEAPIQKISSRYRWQILVKGQKASDLNFLAGKVMAYGKLKPVKDVKLAIDVDPYSLM